MHGDKKWRQQGEIASGWSRRAAGWILETILCWEGGWALEQALQGRGGVTISSVSPLWGASAKSWGWRWPWLQSVPDPSGTGTSSNLFPQTGSAALSMSCPWCFNLGKLVQSHGFVILFVWWEVLRWEVLSFSPPAANECDGKVHGDLTILET